MSQDSTLVQGAENCVLLKRLTQWALFFPIYLTQTCSQLNLAQLGLAWLNLTQFDSDWFSSDQLDSAWLSTTQLNPAAQLSSIQLDSAQLSLTQLDSIQLSITQCNSAWLSLTQLDSAQPQLCSTQLDSTWLSFFQIRPYVCGVVRCHPTALFLVFWHDHTADGGSLLKYYVHRETLLHTTLTKWLLYSATQISAAVWKVQFNEMLFYWMVGETKWHFFLLWQIQTQGLQFIKCVFHDIMAGMYFLFCKYWRNESQSNCLYLYFLFQKTIKKLE